MPVLCEHYRLLFQTSGQFRYSYRNFTSKMATPRVYRAPAGSRRSARIPAAITGTPANARVSLRSDLQENRDRIVCSSPSLIVLTDHLLGCTYK